MLDMASLGHAHIERYAPLALRGTLQPVFSFVCPVLSCFLSCFLFCVPLALDHTVVLYGNAGSAAFFFGPL